MVEDTEIEPEFSGLFAELRSLEQQYNATDRDLHLYSIEPPDTALFVRLTNLAQGGLQAVQEHRAFFVSRPLYADGMFWYRLCLLISAAAGSARRHNTAFDVPNDAVDELAVSLVGISEWSARSQSDMHKRTFEALGDLLLAFPRQELFDLVDTAANDHPAEHTRAFVHAILERVRHVIARRSARATQNKHE